MDTAGPATVGLQGGGRSGPATGAMFNWNDLVYFLELARHRQLNAASKHLRTDATTVGRRVRELEAQLGAKLFTRTRTGFALTDAGHRLLVHAEAMETNARELSQSFGADGDKRLSGTVRVGTMEALGSLYLAQRLAAFHGRQPGITIELVTASNWINLSKREADILISFPRPQGQRLNCNKIGEFQLRLYASHEYIAHRGMPARLADLETHDFIDYIGDLIQISAVRWLSDIMRRPNIVFRSSSLVAQYHAALSGVGIVMLPSFVAARDERLVPVLPKSATAKRDFWLSMHQDLAHTARIIEVEKYVTELIESDQPFLNGTAT
ncbi:LysR family transcriptional regulator [Acuticoccus sp. I52.16.1]|uniref:LysR family transcriptional regulator n=1 Tax=Acuticoccus sp. I52.16.1 TaxID=2928472 RepID=UPI001FD0602D|nr:LysR family transcriptional regulator [Acuticoccus sp. I52.16.1]UOM35730.1 LysR family transcriptional regulator [Acuticoccus sp. I52.16.1]